MKTVKRFKSAKAVQQCDSSSCLEGKVSFACREPVDLIGHGPVSWVCLGSKGVRCSHSGFAGMGGGYISIFGAHSKQMNMMKDPLYLYTQLCMCLNTSVHSKSQYTMYCTVEKAHNNGLFLSSSGQLIRFV